MRSLRVFFPLALLVPSSPVHAQTAAGSSIPTLQAKARIVVVDVVVTDRNQRPVHHLSQNMFNLLEDGQPQTVRIFEEHSAESTTVTSAPVAPAPPGQFTNRTEAPKGAVTVILLDQINTDLVDQAYVRQQLVNYTRTARPGDHIAIFSLTTQLSMLQSFTDDPVALQKAVERVTARLSAFKNLRSADENEGSRRLMEEALSARGDQADLRATQFMMNRERELSALQTVQRGTYTLDGLSALAHYLASIPGRKNLIWMSGSFPLNLQPYAERQEKFHPPPQDLFSGVASLEDKYRETVDLLAQARVSVYPINAKGNEVLPVYESANTKATHIPSTYDKHNLDLMRSSAVIMDNQITMAAMAEDSGGRAFLNTNSLTNAVRDVIEHASDYYTLSYVPTNNDSRKNFRGIRVALAAKGYHLSYRHGYSLNAPAAVESSRPNLTAGGMDRDLFMKMMASGSPAVAQLPFDVKAAPSAEALPKTQIAANNVTALKGFAAATPPFVHTAVSFSVAPENVTFPKDAQGNSHPHLEFVTFVYDDTGRLVNVCTTSMRADLNPEQEKNLKRAGLSSYQVVSVPEQGAYTLRFGVHDLTTNSVGALEVPFGVIRNLPPASF